MAKAKKSLLDSLSTSDLKRMLAARERIDVLEVQQARLVKELAAIEGELEKLYGGVITGTKPAARAKKAAPKKVSAKKAGAKKKTRKKAVAAKKASTRSSGGKVTLEDVVVGVIKSSGKSMSFKEMYAAIVKGKLYTTRSSNFDNVLRRTLSTSTKVKRVARGIYGVKR